MPSPIQSRIINIQKILKVPQTGAFDDLSCSAFELSQSLNLKSIDLLERLKEIQEYLGFTGVDVDGLFGVETLSRLEAIFDTTIPVLPSVTSMIISKKGMEKIFEWEVSGKLTYIKKYQNPIWPGGESGVTIGIGYDLGYYTAKKVSEDFNELPISDLNKLIGLVGLTGQNA